MVNSLVDMKRMSELQIPASWVSDVMMIGMGSTVVLNLIDGLSGQSSSRPEVISLILAFKPSIDQVDNAKHLDSCQNC